MRVAVRSAPGFLDALRMRSVRNSCRSFMTRDQSKIGLLRQVRWWFTRKNVTCFLVEEAGHPIGYGIVLQEGDTGWLSGGLVPNARGRGLGETLFKRLTLHARDAGLTPKLEVLKANPRAERLYLNLGFHEVPSDNPDMRVMELR